MATAFTTRRRGCLGDDRLQETHHYPLLLHPVWFIWLCHTFYNHIENGTIFLKGNVCHRMCFDFLCDCLRNFSHSRNNSEMWRTPLTSRPSYGSTSGISYPYQHFVMPRHQPSSSGTWLPPVTSSDGKVLFVGPCKSRISPHNKTSSRTVRRTHSKFVVSQEVSSSNAWSRRRSFIPTSKPLHHQPLPPVPALVSEGRYDCRIISVSVAEHQNRMTTDNWRNTCRYK